MTNIKNKLNTLTLGILSTLLLSACSSLPFTENNEVEPANLVDNKFVQNTQSLQREIEDFKTMKPSLSRLVALESDLSFLLEEMSRFSEQNPIMFDTTAAPMPGQIAQENPTLIFSEDGMNRIAAEPLVDGWSSGQKEITDKLQTNSEYTRTEIDNLGITPRNRRSNMADVSASSVTNQGMTQSKFTGSNDVEVNAAKPLIQAENKSGTKTSISRSSQVREGNRAVISNNLPNRAQQVATLSKFSDNTSPKAIVGNVNTCKQWEVDSTKTYSLHLASYKSKTSAENGWNQLDKKYADIWCDTPATLAKVSVKGTEYLSLRVGAYESRDKVVELCSVIKQRGDYCAVSTAAGERIQ